MRICIYGAGAVGLGLAASLIKAGTQADIIARPNTIKALQSNGLTRTGIFGRFHAPADRFAAYPSLKNIEDLNYDFVLVCTKSFDSDATAEDLAGCKKLLAQNGKIVLFQNGWGNAEKFLTHFDKEKIYNARVITGFSRGKANEVEITVHADAIHIGSLFGFDTDAVQPLCEMITKGGIDCRPSQTIEKDLWAKMLYNCPLNPVGALLGVTYGRLAEVQSTRLLMDAIIAEAYDVMTSAGYNTHWNCVEDFLKVFYTRLVPSTAGHKSSMLQDLASGKRTEIDALNGAVIKLAEKHSIDVPYNKVVYELIKFMENKT